MLTFLTIAVIIEAVAIAILWVVMRRQIRITAALADIAGKTVGITDALGGLVQKTLVETLWPKKSDDERKSMN